MTDAKIETAFRAMGYVAARRLNAERWITLDSDAFGAAQITVFGSHIQHIYHFESMADAFGVYASNDGTGPIEGFIRAESKPSAALAEILRVADDSNEVAGSQLEPGERLMISRSKAGFTVFAEQTDGSRNRVGEGTGTAVIEIVARYLGVGIAPAPDLATLVPVPEFEIQDRATLEPVSRPRPKLDAQYGDDDDDQAS